MILSSTRLLSIPAHCYRKAKRLASIVQELQVQDLGLAENILMTV